MSRSVGAVKGSVASGSNISDETPSLCVDVWSCATTVGGNSAMAVNPVVTAGTLARSDSHRIVGSPEVRVGVGIARTGHNGYSVADIARGCQQWTYLPV